MLMKLSYIRLRSVVHASVAMSWRLFDRKLSQSMGSVAKSLHKPSPQQDIVWETPGQQGFSLQGLIHFTLFYFRSNQYPFRIPARLLALVKIISEILYLAWFEDKTLKAHSSGITLTPSHLKHLLLSSPWYVPWPLVLFEFSYKVI